MKNIYLLGATGSIGTQTLDVIRQHPDKFRLVAFSAGRNIQLTQAIIEEFQPSYVSVISEEDAKTLSHLYPAIHFGFGSEGLITVATYDEVPGDEHFVLSAVMGSVGLLQGEDSKAVKKLIITASGGSFRDYTREMLQNVTREQALNHPNWSMGAKITIDSASMMNKGLEVIEAHWLFDMPYDRIETILHRQSIIHSMVEFEDTSIIAHLGTPDMRIPIQFAMSYPERIDLKQAKSLNLAEVGTLEFKPMDFERFPCLKMAYDAGRMGGSCPTVLNAANEAAVDLFLRNKISFLGIEEVVYEALSAHQTITNPTLDEILEIDCDVRKNIMTKYE